MILRRYGTTLQSVELDFDAHALNEVGFRRDRKTRFEQEDFAAHWEKVEERALAAATEGPVQDDAEVALLADLERQLRELEAGLDDDEILVVENDASDYPKTRDVKREVVVDGRNRLHFSWRIDPPLRVGVYRRSAPPPP